MTEKTKQEKDDGRIKYKEEVGRRVEAEDVWLLMVNNEYLRRRNNEMKESMKRQEEELEKTKKDIFLRWKWMRLYQDEVEKRREVEEMVKSIQEELKQVNKEKEKLESEPPSYFICPISKDIMQEPHFAADGFTYEAEELRKWLDSGNKTSPMTNLRLAHKKLVPNLALRSAIQEWLTKNS